MRHILAGWCLLLLVASPGAAQSAGDFRWSGTVARGKTIEIKGVNGDVRAERSPGAEVEVVATKRGRRSDPSTVSVEVVQEDGNVTICAVYPTPSGSDWFRGRRGARGPNECRPGEAGHMNTDNNDVRVDFVVKLPAGVRFVGRTVNGSVEARDLESDADVRTVNGAIWLTTTGVGRAQTVNGSIEASIGSANWSETLGFKTVNGSITLRLPKDVSTNLRAEMLNGRFESDFPVLVQSFRGRNRRVVGTIGQGGRDLELTTVNGSVHLRFVTN